MARDAESQPPETRWHYTVTQHYPSIMKEGRLRLATLHVATRERPVVWFSTQPFWEPTACKGIIENGVRRTATFEEMRDTGLVRFGVRPSDAPYDWHAYLRKSRIDRGIADGLLEVARALGADPNHWFVSFRPVAIERCIAIEFLHEGTWVQ